MPSNNGSPPPRINHRIVATVDHADVLRDILLKPNPYARRGTGDRQAQRDHKHIQSGKSRAPETVARVLGANGRWGEFGDACIARDPSRSADIPLDDAISREARADYDLRCAELAYAGGDRSSATLNMLREASAQVARAAMCITHHALRQQFAPRILRRTA